MDFDTFDTDFWNEIQDAPGEIFDIEEGMEDEQTWNEFVNSNVTVWWIRGMGLPLVEKLLLWCYHIYKILYKQSDYRRFLLSE